MYIKNLKIEDGLLKKGCRLWVAEDDQLRLDFIKKVHNQQTVSYPELARILKMLQQHYYWPGMKATTKQYIQNCHVCLCAKAPCNTYNSLLQPLPVLEQPWVNLTMDFVIGLPKCHVYGQVYDAIFIVIN